MHVCTQFVFVFWSIDTLRKVQCLSMYSFPSRQYPICFCHVVFLGKNVSVSCKNISLHQDTKRKVMMKKIKDINKTSESASSTTMDFDTNMWGISHTDLSTDEVIITDAPSSVTVGRVKGNLPSYNFNDKEYIKDICMGLIDTKINKSTFYVVLCLQHSAHKSVICCI